MVGEHRFDHDSDFCVKCGQAKEIIEDGIWPIKCPASENVSGVSHIIFNRKTAVLLERVLNVAEALKEEDHDSA